EENKSFDDIIGNTKHAPYLNQLAERGALFTHSYGVAHPSQPNYFALFAGRTNSDGDSCTVRAVAPDAPNLGAQLLAAHRSFVGYAEGLPAPGFRACVAGNYARKHAPWTHFTTIPDNAIQPLTAFPRDLSRLPTVAFVIPDLEDDMHSGSISHGDAWLKRRLDPVVSWAATHDTLIIITWDESDEALSNHIPTLFIGPMVKSGRVDETIDHYSVLRTLEDFYRLPHAGRAATVAPIMQAWERS
ncbi:MAG TPA: alkaline phosphatase family protein, partial [Candidatus Acidoferrum sp.]|nr:alkaline phosphatase family protein [Candidatus Acidoferrum sp.]